MKTTLSKLNLNFLTRATDLIEVVDTNEETHHYYPDIKDDKLKLVSTIAPKYDLYWDFEDNIEISEDGNSFSLVIDGIKLTARFLQYKPINLIK